MADHEAELLAVARDYATWDRVDESMQWAPLDCAAPRVVTDIPELSAAETGPHERKLYYLYSPHASRYLSLGADAITPASVEVVVKETFAAVPKGPGFEKGERGPLFVMLAVDDDVASDEGWIYGVLSPDGSRVETSGVIASCSGCHAQATHGRLFGYQP